MYLGCFFFSIRRRHTRCALVTGFQTCALPISLRLDVLEHRESGGADDGVAAERRAVVALLQRIGGAPGGEHGTQRKPSAEPLGEGEDVGGDPWGDHAA